MAEKGQILIVDDSEENVTYISEILEEHGYGFKVAGDGDEALGLLENWRPDLVLLDLMMPRRSGIHVLRKMNADERLRSIPVIVCTGASGATGVDMKTGEAKPIEVFADQFDRGVGRGFHGRLSSVSYEDLIEKPIDPKKLSGAIARLLER